MTEERKSASKKQLEAITKIEKDVDQSMAILKKIDHQSNQQLNILSLHGKKLEEIENVAKTATVAIAENIKQIAQHLGETVQTNRELINIIAGKRQVPLSIFVIVLFILAAVEFIVLSQVFSIGFEFDTTLFKGKIIPHHISETLGD